ncbi:HAD family hydrolase [candidate division FCPU426 bacterium]|nr:HAD family hydrolase [candidate division FCPU426 bacterium]
MLKAVLFDLDDTLVDHKYCRQCALAALQARYPDLRRRTIQELEQEQEKQLQANYALVLDGSLTPEEALAERIRGVCATFGVELAGPAEAFAAAAEYERVYGSNWRLIPGAADLLAALHGRVKLGVITNGKSSSQRAKLKACGLEQWLDFAVVSEEFGAAKPDQAIFFEALKLARAEAGETVFIGDSWEVDIAGASQSGLKAVWINRYGRSCPDPGLAWEIHAYEPLSQVLAVIGTLPAGR